MTGKTAHKLWNDLEIVAAIAGMTNQMTISGAANHFHVPRNTFDDRIKGHVKHGSKLGRYPVLSAVEEDFSYLPFIHGRSWFSID